MPIQVNDTTESAIDEIELDVVELDQWASGELEGPAVCVCYICWP